MIKEINDAHWLIQNATAGPYMVVMSTSMFTDVIEMLMQQPSIIAGILVYDNVTER